MPVRPTSLAGGYQRIRANVLRLTGVRTICHSTRVISFKVDFRPGISLYQQVVYAAKKAVVSGRLRPGDVFPSVRTLSKELKINPNTAHKVIAQMVSENLLETRPGVGTVVAPLPEPSAQERTRLLGEEIEALVVEAKKLGIELEDITASVAEHWRRLGPGDARASGREGRGKR
ncbi:MAG TPA: GntR family transcriptional regulator [Terriglobia bacterium]|nr:GntR family transcriptional regulator [Terriglobia bacterium]